MAVAWRQSSLPTDSTVRGTAQPQRSGSAHPQAGSHRPPRWRHDPCCDQKHVHKSKRPDTARGTQISYSILIFAFRKPGTTPEQFRAHNEGSHVLLIKEIAGKHFPLSHTRRYVHRSEGKAEGTERNADYPATILMGSQADFDYDAFAELTFANLTAFQTFFGITQQPENQARIQADDIWSQNFWTALKCLWSSLGKQPLRPNRDKENAIIRHMSVWSACC